MPEAVIVSAARSPIGRANKGSLTELRPDDLAAFIVRAALDKVGLLAREKAMPVALSGGEQQRLCIARAIATRPEVLLMDEPCSALDPRSTAVIEELIGQLRHELAIVIVTHNLQQAYRVGDRVVRPARVIVAE